MNDKIILDLDLYSIAELNNIHKAIPNTKVEKVRDKYFLIGGSDLKCSK